jgi:hypothetical protein
VQDLAKRLELTEVRFLRFNRKEQGKGQRLTEIIMRAIPGFLEPREGESLAATLYVFTKALRERPGTLPIADFQDLSTRWRTSSRAPAPAASLAACLLAARVLPLAQRLVKQK